MVKVLNKGSQLKKGMLMWDLGLRNVDVGLGCKVYFENSS